MRTIRCFVPGILIAVLAVGCGSVKKVREPRSGPGGVTPSGGDDGDGFSKERAKGDKDKGRGPHKEPPSVSNPNPVPPAKASSVEAMAGTDKPISLGAKLPPSGILTAGNFDDAADPQAYRAFLKKVGQNADLGELPSKFQGQPLLITIKDNQGKPVGNAKVVVESSERSVELITRSDGRAVVLPIWDRLSQDGDLKITIDAPGGGPKVTKTIPKGSEPVEITLSGTQTVPVKNLDLAIVLDTTGSMGDELNFLQSEIKSISSTIRTKFPQINQHYGLVLFRDEGDIYVTRSFPFTASVDEFHKNLVAQSAAGGGDEPEATHRGLEDAKQLRWREAETVRVLFLITDAPPHEQYMQRTMEAANVLRKKGIAIYPLACSGYNTSAEFILRTCALMTGSEFLFLTDDSGVGNSHAEPRIPSYSVQRLDKLMVRMISSELSGQRLDPELSDILRTVGRPQIGRGPKP